MSTQGLPPAAYAKLVDVDPPIADHVLDLLSRGGIAAYAEPLVGETGPYRDVRAPDRPTTRIFADRTRLRDAREVIATHLPELRADFHADAAARADADDMRRSSTENIDSAWDELVAGFHTAEPPPRPAVDPDPAARPDTPPGSGLSERLVREHTRQPPTSGGPRDYSPIEDPDDERFVPPVPPPIPRPRDRFDTLGWTGVIAGPIAIVLAFVLGGNGWLATAGFAAFTAGFITLIARTSDRRDGGDGAVV
jgi:hypothetical protein